MHECLNPPRTNATIIYIHYIQIRVWFLPSIHSVSLANVYMHMLTLHINACHKAYIYNELLYTHIAYNSITTQCKTLPFGVVVLKGQISDSFIFGRLC